MLEFEGSSKDRTERCKDVDDKNNTPAEAVAGMLGMDVVLEDGEEAEEQAGCARSSCTGSC